MEQDKTGKTFEDNTLLRLRRQFSENEACKFLFEQISKLKFRVGELQSENAELADMLKKEKLRKDPASGNPVKKNIREWDKDQLVADLKKNISTQQKNNSELTKKLKDWRDKYFSLLAQTEKKTT